MESEQILVDLLRGPSLEQVKLIKKYSRTLIQLEYYDTFNSMYSLQHEQIMRHISFFTDLYNINKTQDCLYSLYRYNKDLLNLEYEKTLIDHRIPILLKRVKNLHNRIGHFLNKDL